MTNWRETIDVKEPFRDDSLTLEEKTKSILDIFKKSKWYKKSVEDPDYIEDTIGSWVEEVEYCMEYEADEFDFDYFNTMWSAMYNLADRDKIWVNVW